MAIHKIRAFFNLEASGGIVLALAAIAAMIIANTSLNTWYESFIHAPVAIQIGSFSIAKDAHHWINDGLMAVFFFLVGLELKREVLIGELSNVKQIILPAGAALGGMIMPAIVYLFFNYNEPEFWRGWAIPAATDIAFALGILSLLGNRVPNSLKVFLVSIAIFDDIGAIIIIALFYTNDLSLGSLAIAGLCLPFLYLLNRRNVTSITPYLLIGVIMWVAVLKSGIHATLAGVVLALFIPLFDRTDPEHSPLEELEHDLQNTVSYGILPLFAFANAGISLKGAGFGELFHSVPLGIAAGLFIGKQVGVMLMCWLIFKLGISTMPKGMNFKQIYGAALLCGVGFTMSLFIGGLAFAGETPLFDERLGIIMGSIVSGIAGYMMLKATLKDEVNVTSVDLTRHS
ncbi:MULTISPECIES: Na+/H+ antiporter NhaA [Psychrobacter]|uniref:Na(+)/H(+) antiporter NhaA n=2 Tax=Psychrobacter TaxID=497 RepID=NHAA_PSYCK|nr:MULTISPECIES: Na+/H+ antiporter NhaA [Psychrobacter]Q1Q8V3.1 RecName: Full=Na(+)/H(+) antiporter NhaA; AltName: Full=Sodium/proton antiporter NhaA [Psychrobacter cryohalolentis K5]ABE75900.1 sodium/proton antiporter, NhaA family [Psychrobacter cryohalolentis K5]AGP49774.1 sodium:proton antiporter [Psychrobacter sp. G]ASE26081.1 Na+/H+ antiporter NhaA [Psychrobacter cryohalolentis]KAA0928673.1 Na+/H+ antiporter NhaA [Psychrobacter sp. ANT_H56B]KAA0938616.1 Na+/H+ antiporter NhaA [Psychrobac